MALECRTIASLAEWSCKGSEHDDNDRLLITTDWGETLVAKTYCEVQHDAGIFVLDDTCVPENLHDYLAIRCMYTGVKAEVPLVYLYDSILTYGRGLFRLELAVAWAGVLLRLQSNGCIVRIEHTLATQGRCVSSNFSFITLSS